MPCSEKPNASARLVWRGTGPPESWALYRPGSKPQGLFASFHFPGHVLPGMEASPGQAGLALAHACLGLHRGRVPSTGEPGSFLPRGRAPGWALGSRALQASPEPPAPELLCGEGSLLPTAARGANHTGVSLATPGHRAFPPLSPASSCTRMILRPSMHPASAPSLAQLLGSRRAQRLSRSESGLVIYSSKPCKSLKRKASPVLPLRPLPATLGWRVLSRDHPSYGYMQHLAGSGHCPWYHEAEPPVCWLMPGSWRDGGTGADRLHKPSASNGGECCRDPQT